ncbi:oligosaccharyl transferase delta subunit [Guyanagaster necrorhizus]|uniref:Ribophorin II n=1 Tax=Guyanagaster necrorhizus TaxID=856835 RepID=A0A9P7VXD4_9AGAR|nr:oligosaccharyl transferase delta subunit [Guyanagaster necrorhizus MCA 3950]KAG7448667.1 oligosaccharyl transferase delta subunit [Guyanagaster necrorhizus MCA 3950]
MFSFASLLLLAAAVNASVLTLHSPRFSVTSSGGPHLRSEPISLVHKTPEPVTLSPTDMLKLTFQVIDADSGKGVQPQQTFLRFYDEESGEEGIQPIRVTSGGKAKFELNMAKVPPSLPATSKAALKVSLIIGTPNYSPFKISLFDLFLPPSHPVTPHPDEASFHPLPFIEHTFRPEPTQPPRPISAFFVGLVLSPWIVLLGLWVQISPRVPRLFSAKILPFTATLGAFEVLLLWYWVDLKLGEVLLYGGILGVVMLFSGKYALASISERRLGSQK